MHFEMLVNVEFDVLDAAINECLPGYAPAGWVEFTRHQLTYGSVIYDLYLEKSGDLGDLGSITVRKAREASSILYVTNPTRPSPGHPSQEEWASYNFSQYPKEIRFSKKLELLNKYRDEAKELYNRRRNHQKRIIQALFNRLADDTATSPAFSQAKLPEESDPSPLEASRAELHQFASFAERQLVSDILVDGKPREAIARGFLQSFLTSRSYREVPVRGGRSDIITTHNEGRILFETKIWRGKGSFSAGLDETQEYAIGENSDQKLLGIFYVVFDPTKTHQATLHLGCKYKILDVAGYPIEVFVIDLSLPTPSKKGFA